MSGQNIRLVLVFVLRLAYNYYIFMYGVCVCSPLLVFCLAS